MTVQLRNDIQVQIPGYQINRLVGERDGTMIYIAYDIERQRPVAIKLFNSDATANRFTSTRLRKDVRQLSRLNHPNIITVYDAGSADDREFVVADYYGGGTLADRLQIAMQPGQALAVALAIAEALRYSHACGAWHHNLKPSNIAFRHDGSVAISDFLSSKPVMLRDASSATTSANYGDDFEEKIQADVRSLGKLLFWMLAGHPADGENHTLPEEMARFQTIIDQLTASKPAISADEAIELLNGIQENEEHILAINIPRAKLAENQAKPRQITDIALWILAAVVGALTIAATIQFIR